MKAILIKFSQPIECVILATKKRFLLPTKYYVSYEVTYPARERSREYGSVYGYHYDRIVPAKPKITVTEGGWVTAKDLIFTERK